MVCFVLGILSVPVWAFSGFINLHPLAGLCPFQADRLVFFSIRVYCVCLASLGKWFGVIPSQPPQVLLPTTVTTFSGCLALPHSFPVSQISEEPASFLLQAWKMLWAEVWVWLSFSHQGGSISTNA